MRTKTYQTPNMKVVKLESTAILTGSNGSTERLNYGGDIFGGGAYGRARGGSRFDDEEDF